MQFGYFDDAQRTYVITTPKTPVKWINYLGTLDFGGFIDNNGGMVMCKGDPALNRMTKYLTQNPSSDFRGATLYLRITDAQGHVRIVTPLYTPALTDLDRFECHVGLSYNRFVSEVAGVRCDMTCFVPRDDQVLLEDIRITNISDAPLTVDVIPLFEFTHFDALKQLTNADWVPQTMTLKAHTDADGHLTLHQYAFMKRDTAINVLACDRPVQSFEGDRNLFLGDYGYGSWANPKALQQPMLGNSECVRGDNIGALHLALGSLAPGASERTVVQLCQVANADAALVINRRYRDLAAVDAAFAALGQFWDRYLGALQVSTPDGDMNAMLNIHNPRQCHTTRYWSRFLSLYQLGYGARGIGFRDSAQDLLGVMAHMPVESWPFVERLLSVQKPDGSAMHQYLPSTMEASMGDAHEAPDRPQYYGDDHLWIVLTVAQYVRETGDLAVLDRVVPFYAKSGAREQGSVWEHLCRAVHFTRHNRGAHGLPLLGFADWNDTVNLPAGAESVMIACMFGKALQEMMALASARRESAREAEYADWYAEMAACVNTHAWDGDWYRRYFDERGDALGSAANAAGQIYANGQSWPVMAGFATPERATQALDSVLERLNTDHGIKLSTPGFNGFDSRLGGISTYPPGAKENGGIFLHANPWIMIAETLTGNGDRAYRYYRQINPVGKQRMIERHEAEPYVYCQNILGDEHPQFGLARNAWLSGTGAWAYVAATQWILGIRPAIEGLIVDPCIPSAWHGFEAVRRFRGAVYHITVHNPDGVNKGVRHMTVNGTAVAGYCIPVQGEGEHHVVVTLG